MAFGKMDDFQVETFEVIWSDRVERGEGAGGGLAKQLVLPLIRSRRKPGRCAVAGPVSAIFRRRSVGRRGERRSPPPPAATTRNRNS